MGFHRFRKHDWETLSGSVAKDVFEKDWTATQQGGQDRGRPEENPWPGIIER